MLEDAGASLVLTTSDMQPHMEPIAKAAGVRMHVMGPGTSSHAKASLVCLSTAVRYSSVLIVLEELTLHLTRGPSRH